MPALSFCLRDSATGRLAPSALIYEILQSPSAFGPYSSKGFNG